MDSLPLSKTSTPNLEEFDPTLIPYQYRVIRDVRLNYDYSLGVHEILLSGSVGSAKSLLMAHLGLTHCLLYERARCILGRKAMPDLKDTIATKMREHLEGIYEEGTDYKYTENTAHFEFRNGSEIISRSWADKKYRKLRSLEASIGLVEELTENDNDEFEGFYKELKARVGRLPHIPESFICSATNPDAPSHSAYDYFINSNIATRHVYYSITRDNPFLPKNYEAQLRETYTAEECRRMIEGEWIEIKTEVIYYAFDKELSLTKGYKVNPRYPICISFDFNIGEGKPFSVILFQYIDKKFYFFDEVVVQGMRTLDAIEEMAARGLLDYPTHYIIFGDAAGRARTTKYNKTDYEVIRKFLANYKPSTQYGLRDFSFEVDVPVSNPPVRERHLLVNGQLKNANNKTHIFIDQDKCHTLIKGFSLARLKKGGQYIENDDDSWQHITTAAGYGIVRQIKNNESFNRSNYGRAY